jgi:predicted DNA repair protein MutK
MAGSLLLLLDDIASALDDVATMTKAAAAKTAGVIGDDLALNAKQVAGVAPDRELAVVAAVARGSAVNKAILVPAALALGWLAPWAVQPLLMLGGAYLCFEGVEKLVHGLLHARRHRHGTGHRTEHASAAGVPGAPPAAVGRERDRIRGAIRTDFILSAEIIVITLGIVAGQSWLLQAAVLSAVAILMTVFVYGLVAAIVKLDDLGLRLSGSPTGWIAGLGRGLVAVSPRLLRTLSVAGTAAMFLVGGGIVAHALPAVHDAVHTIVGGLVGDAPWRGWVDWCAEGVVGLAIGAVGFALVTAGRALTKQGAAPAA